MTKVRADQGGIMAAGTSPERRTVRDVPVAATVCLVAIGLLFGALAIIYFAEPAHDLPGLIPGSDKDLMRHHIKHGLLSLALGLTALFAAASSAGRRPATIEAVGGPMAQTTDGPAAEPGPAEPSPTTPHTSTPHTSEAHTSEV